MSSAPPPPEDLSASAAALWREVVDVYELEGHEAALLRESCRTMTTCDRLAEVLEVEGLLAAGSQGQRVVHPAVPELRQTRLVLARLLAQLRLPEGEDAERPSRARGDGRPQRRGGSRRIYAVGGSA